jgi:hypothetical protein
MNKKILLALIPENSQELISNFHAIQNLSHPNFEIELKAIANVGSLSISEKNALDGGAV